MTKTTKNLDGYELLVCVTGGIACFKSAELVSKLVQARAGVNVAMTESSKEFITPLTFQSLTRRATFVNLWQSTEAYSTQHIALTDMADLVIVAPATANCLAKMACGLADDLVSTLLLSACGSCPILVAPAMNERMWNAPVTQANIRRIGEFGGQVIGPCEGRLACGTVGIGRMAEPADIVEAVQTLLQDRPAKKLKG